MAIIADTISRIKRNPLAVLDGAERIYQCFAEAGHVWRDCVLTPARTMKLFVLHVLHGNTAIRPSAGTQSDRFPEVAYWNRSGSDRPVVGVSRVGLRNG